MEKLLASCVLFVAGCILTGSAIPTDKRNVYQFGNMISCLNNEGITTSYDKYDGYGCYCGLGGEGLPVDETDRCCKLHDECYGRASESGKCPRTLQDSYVYVVYYRYLSTNCDTPNGEITCAPLDEYSWYDTLYPECAVLLCECDREGAVCFSQNEYHQEFYQLDQKECLSKENM